jgi:hypothetical protein
MAPFGSVIPVLGVNLGFLGQISRGAGGDRFIVAKQANVNNQLNIFFGDAVVVLPDSTGGTLRSVADFIGQGGAFTAELFAGVANREVKTNLQYPITPGNGPINYYAPGEMAEHGVRGSATVAINVGQPVCEAPVFIRTVANGSIAAGKVGGFEAAADGSTTAAAAAGNTGNGTLAAVPTVGAAAISGVYVILMKTATTYNVVDPNGRIIGAGTTGVAFASTGINFTLNAGGTPFAKGDSFNVTATMLTVSLASRGVVFKTGVLDGNGVAEITLLHRQAA